MDKIYKITNIVNGKVYIGVTSASIESRFKKHCYEAENGSSRRLCCAMRKYGISNFHVELLEAVESQFRSQRESYWIDQFSSMLYEKGYNMTSGGEGTPGALISERQKERISESVRASRALLSESQKKELTAAANTAKKGSEESADSRKKKSEAQLKRWSAIQPEMRSEIAKKSASSKNPEDMRRSAIKASSDSPVNKLGYRQPKVTCPHCSKTGGIAAMNRYHFDNCKHAKKNQ